MRSAVWKQRINYETRSASVTIQFSFLWWPTLEFHCDQTNCSEDLKFWMLVQNLTLFPVMKIDFPSIMLLCHGIVWIKVWHKCDSFNDEHPWIVTLQENIDFSKMKWKKSLKFGGNVVQLVVNAMTKEKMLNVWTIIGLQKKLSAYLILRKKWQKNKGEEYHNSNSFFVILQLKYWIQTFYTYQWIDSDCLQTMGWPPLTFFDWLNLHFACRDRIGTGQNRPFYPYFEPQKLGKYGALDS